MVWALVSGLGGADWLWVERAGAPPSPIWTVTEGIQAGTGSGKWVMLAALAARLSRQDFAALLGLEVVAELLLLWRASLVEGIPSVFAALLVLAVVRFDHTTPRRLHGPQLPPRRGSWWLAVACGSFMAMGVVLVFDFDGPMFIPYRRALLDLDPTPPWPLVELAYGRIAVGFCVHYAALCLALCIHGADLTLLRSAMLAQLAWVLPDSIACLMTGAAFNVVMINLPAMVLFTGAWWLTVRRASRDPREALPSTPPARDASDQ